MRNSFQQALSLVSCSRYERGHPTINASALPPRPARRVDACSNWVTKQHAEKD